MNKEIALREPVVLAPSEHTYLTKDLPKGQLPALLERAIGISDNPVVKDMLLLSTLTACGFALPRIKTVHDPKKKKVYAPNLMSLIVARAASGKGVMNSAHTLIEKMERALKAIGRAAEIPANSSSAAFLDLLSQYGGTAIMIATEMDELSQVWKKDYGNYSHIFRQAFEHEKISRARKSGAHGVIKTDIPHPRLSVLLSGTYNQVQPLLGNQENGLVSRFIPYLVEDETDFDMHVMDNCDNMEGPSLEGLFQELGEELYDRWVWLLKQDHDCLWALTDDQAKQLAAFFHDGFHFALDEMELPEDFDASIFRMAVTIKRIGMILGALRLDMSQPLPERVYCSDEDFLTLGKLAEQLLKHAARLSMMLPDAKTNLREGYGPMTRAEKKMLELFEVLPERFSASDAIAIGAQLGMSRATVYRHLAGLQDAGLLASDWGVYVKTK